MFSRLHPTAWLVVWLALLVAMQSLPGGALAFIGLVFFLLGGRIARRGFRLAWRTRWLLLSLCAVFAWGTAGAPLWEAFWAPTREGLHAALIHAGRLFLMLMAVAAFLETMPVADLLTATHGLLKPWRRFGVDSERSVVRLMLVLRYAETLPRPRDWQRFLGPPAIAADEASNESVEIAWRDLTGSDYVLMAAAWAAALAAGLAWGGAG